jgi:two-component system, sensor histidine kinase PdtaS
MIAVADASSEMQWPEALQLVVVTAPNPKLLMDDQGHIAVVNPQLETLFGYRRGQLSGRAVEVLLPQRLRGAHVTSRNEFLRDPEPRAMTVGRELLGLRSSGEEFPIEIGLSPITLGGRTWVLASIFDITQRKRAEAVLKFTLARQETLLREVHHRIKNNLQVIVSLLSLQAMHAQDASAKDVLRSSGDRIKAIALLHEKLYGATNSGSVDFGAYAAEFSRQLFDSYAIDPERVRLEIDVVEASFGMETATTCAMILNEVLTNCLKHAFPDGRQGTVRVVFRKEDDRRWRLSVQDDGVGLQNTVNFARSTLGMKLLHALASQVDGVANIDYSRGTTFELVFFGLDYKPRV